MDRWTCRVQFSAQCVAIAVLAMVRFSVRIRGGAHMLEACFRQGRLILRQRALSSTAGRKENKCDENRQQD